MHRATSCRCLTPSDAVYLSKVHHRVRAWGLGGITSGRKAATYCLLDKPPHRKALSARMGTLDRERDERLDFFEHKHALHFLDAR